MTEADVVEEIGRLEETWSCGPSMDVVSEVLGARADALDLFDRHQLGAVVDICRSSQTLSAAGRKLFAVSRLEKKEANDADRLRKYLQRFALSFETVQPSKGTEESSLSAARRRDTPGR